MPSLLINVVDCIAFSLFLYFSISYRNYRRRRGLSYPPGPPSRLIIGNLLDVPKEAPWISYADMSKKFGMTSFSLQPLAQTDTRSKATLFVSVFLVKSSSCCPRHQPSRICLRSVGKPTQIDLHSQSWKCAPGDAIMS